MNSTQFDLRDTVLHVSPSVTNGQLNILFAASWPNHGERDFQAVLGHSLLYVCAYSNEGLIGFVNLAWDGGVHAFLLDTTVHPDFRNRGVGRKLVGGAIESARSRKIKWVHVDYEPHLQEFYASCGFKSTLAGLVHII